MLQIFLIIVKICLQITLVGLIGLVAVHSNSSGKVGKFRTFLNRFVKGLTSAFNNLASFFHTNQKYSLSLTTTSYIPTSQYNCSY